MAKTVEEILTIVQNSGYAIAADWADSEDAEKVRQDALKDLEELIKAEVIGEKIDIRFIPYEEYSPTAPEVIELIGELYEPINVQVCAVCGWWENDPESGHGCEADNLLREHQLDNLTKVMKG